MAKVLFRGTECELEPGESVLDCLLRYGYDCVYSCRTGKCRACLLRADEHEAIPPVSQKGLKETWTQRGYFMPCVSRISGDTSMTLRTVDEAERAEVELLEKKRLSSAVTRIRLRPRAELKFQPGQFVTLLRDENLVGRSYSIASLPHEGYLELHVRRWPGGAMSPWIHDELEPGDSLYLRGPYGECFYVPGEPERPLLLIGTGTGAAPLWGVLRHALHLGHTGPIVFMHKGHDEDALYLHEELLAMEEKHESLTYRPCVTIDGGEAGVSFGSIIEMARNQLLSLPDPTAARAYICGNPDVVKMLRKELFLAGLSMRDIFFDAFVYNTLQKRHIAKVIGKQLTEAMG